MVVPETAPVPFVTRREFWTLETVSALVEAPLWNVWSAGLREDERAELVLQLVQAVGERRFRNAAFRHHALPFDDTFDHRLINHCLPDNLLRFGGLPDGFAGRRRRNGCRGGGVCRLHRLLLRLGGCRRSGVRAYEFHARLFAIAKPWAKEMIHAIQKRRRERSCGCEVCVHDRERLLGYAGEKNEGQ